MKHMEMFTGRIGRVDDVKELANGSCVVNFSVAETIRIKTGDTWADGPTIWTNVVIFGDEARNLHRSVKPGTFVTVIGERRASEYTPKDSTETRTSQSVVAEQVAIAITKWNYVEGIGNVNYAKDGIPAAGSANPSPQSAPPANPFMNGTPGAPAGATNEDPFADKPADNIFGNNDDDPFGLNS